MKRILVPAICLCLLTGLFSCQKEAADMNDPEIIVCYFEPYVPFRVLNSNGVDLLSPAKLQNGTLQIKWEYPGGGSMAPVKMTTATYYQPGQADQYYMSVPLTHANKGLSIYFSLKDGETDTLFIRTSAEVSKPYGVNEVTFNGKKIDPKILFGTGVYGLELIKQGDGY